MQGANIGPPTADELTKAAVNGHVESVRDLLNRGVAPDARNTNGYTALQTMNWHFPELAQLLLDRGADPNVKDRDGRTTLHDAVQCGIRETVMCLLQGGADANIKDKFGNTPAHIAAQEGKEQMLDLLEKYKERKVQTQEQKHDVVDDQMGTVTTETVEKAPQHS